MPILTSISGKLKYYINKGHHRSVNAKKNIIALFLIKGFSIAISLLLVPLTIHYINPAQYGIWLTLGSIIGWFSYFDIGFGNGLRNKFAESIARGEHDLARIYVSTTYAILCIIVTILLILFFCINPFLNWARILNSPTGYASELSLLAMIVFVFFCVQFVLKLLTTLMIANQQPAKADFLNLLGSLFALTAIFILTKSTSGNLIYVGFCMSFMPVLVLMVSTIWSYSHEYREYAPSLKYIRFDFIRDLKNLGVQFFIIQISGLVLYYTDNIIITQLYGPAEVIPYNIAFKYFSLIIMVFSIVVTPYWSGFTDAYTKGDLVWINRSMNKLLKGAVILSLIAVVMIFFSDKFYTFWIGDKIHIPFLLSCLMCTYFILSLFLTPLTFFINGVGKIRIQLIQSVFSALLNIPLAIFFAVHLHLGISGIILATIICYIPGMVLAPIQYYRLINRTASGLWNK